MKYRNFSLILMVLAAALPLACHNTYTVGPLSAGISTTATVPPSGTATATHTPTTPSSCNLTSATLSWASDDAGEIFINGNQANLCGNGCWTGVNNINVPIGWINTSGDNVLAGYTYAVDAVFSGTTWLLTLNYSSGSPTYVSPGGCVVDKYLFDPNASTAGLPAAASFPANWNTLPFNDSSWSAPGTIGALPPVASANEVLSYPPGGSVPWTWGVQNWITVTIGDGYMFRQHFQTCVTSCSATNPTSTSTSTATSTSTVTSTPTPSGVGYNCNSDTAAGVTVTRAINPSKSFVPLCNGVVLYGDRQNAQIVEYNVITNTTMQTFALTGTPGDLALDSANGYLYCTLDGATKIERVNLTTGVVTGITTTDIGDHLSAANGLVFVCQGVWNTQTLTIINGNAGTVLNTVAIPYVGFPFYESSTNTLYFGVEGFSPSYLYSYAYNPGTYTITQNAVNMNAGSNGEDLIVSPDDNHLAFSVGSGNTNPLYSIVDFPPANILGSNGSWNTGAYPETAGFSPDSQHLVSTNGNNVFVFSTSNYTTSKTWSNVETGVPSIFRARFSQGGDFVFLLMGDKTSTTAPASIFCSSYP